MKRGYTLLEVAVSLTIIGILIAIAIGSILPMAMTRSMSEFKMAAENAKGWVDAFIISNRRLPTEVEFENAHPVNKDGVALEYKVNPNIASFNLPELYQGYKIDRKDPTNFVYIRAADDGLTPDNATAPPVDFAYAIDAYHEDWRGGDKKGVYRQISRYYQFVKLLGGVKQQNHVRILTQTLPRARRLERYYASLRISGGVIKAAADAEKNCDLGRSLEVAVGIRAPELWYSNFGSESGFNTWNTLKNLTAAFRGQPGVFEIGTDCGIGIGNINYRRVCDPYTFEVKKTPAANQWTKLACTPNSVEYNFKIASSGVIPPYLKNYDWKFPQMSKDRGAKGALPNGCAYNANGASGALPDSCIGGAYVGEYFYLVVFVKDNNDIDENGNPKIVSKSYRVDTYPLRGSDPAR
ncbi:MAG: prepilin-type N-terminal cleavage/methylation domain-containing protein [Deferribacteraceae bacterium]|jgi:prepilin-type N-terminal cleavage/methylation domain-containing protein|nr:prepilin-type N-terminal cleavage/methylation domain-containing protein [Deferribacteraceae bacterium]